jgi:hypothetical protein
MPLFKNLFGFTSDRRHLFLIVGPNQWPINLAFSVFVTVLALIFYLHNYGIYLFIFGLVWMLKNVIYWSLNILEESEGYHTLIVRKSLKFGFILFIIPEIMLFLGFFLSLLSFLPMPFYSPGITLIIRRNSQSQILRDTCFQYSTANNLRIFRDMSP